jgi:outer membrane protein assembly factor BamB
MLTVVALRASSGQHLWQSSPVTLPAENLGDAHITSGGRALYVSISAPHAQGTPGTGTKAKGQIIALDAQTGRVRWKAGLDGAIVQNVTVGEDGDIYMQVDNRVEAYDGMSGARLWSDSTDANYQLIQLLVTKAAVYVEQEAYFLKGSQEGSTYDSAIVRALRLGAGVQIWRHDVANTFDDGLISLARVSMRADEQAVYLLRVGQVQEGQGNVTVLLPRTTLFALRPQDGSPLWSDPTQTGDAGVDFELFLSGQTLYMRGSAAPGLSSLSGFRTQNGKLLWTWRTPFVLNPFEPPSHIYGATLNQGETFCALRRSDGTKAWCAPYNQAGPVLFGGPGRICLVAFKVMYQGTSSSEQPPQLYILNESDGSQIAQYSPGKEPTATILDLALS